MRGMARQRYRQLAHWYWSRQASTLPAIRFVAWMLALSKACGARSDDFDQAVGAGLTKATLYSEVGVLNRIDVDAVDGAGNRSAPASVEVDLR